MTQHTAHLVFRLTGRGEEHLSEQAVLALARLECFMEREGGRRPTSEQVAVIIAMDLGVSEAKPELGNGFLPGQQVVIRKKGRGVERNGTYVKMGTDGLVEVCYSDGTPAAVEKWRVVKAGVNDV